MRRFPYRLTDLVVIGCASALVLGGASEAQRHTVGLWYAVTCVTGMAATLVCSGCLVLIAEALRELRVARF